MNKGGKKEDKGPPKADDIPDVAHLISMIEAEGNTDPEFLFALAYLKTNSPSTSYEIAFDLDPIGSDEDESMEDRTRELSKRFILGNSLLNSPNVQVHLADLYHRLGTRLNVSPEAMIARLWMAANSPMVLEKDIPKIMETILKVKNPGTAGGRGDMEPGGGAPTVHVYVGGPSAPAPVDRRLDMAGEASVPMVSITSSVPLGEPVPLDQVVPLPEFKS